MTYDVMIIGSGPAGLSAAIYAARARLSAVVLEKEYMSGGQVLNTYEVDNYPGLPGIGGYELGMKFREHAEKLGVNIINIEAKHIELEEEGRIKAVFTSREEYRARTLVLAMGAKPRMLGVPGEKQLTGMGVSYCATCDGAFFRDRSVAVVGGGDSAAEDALFLARSCEKVYLIHRREELRAAKSLQERLREFDNIEFVWNTEVTEIRGEEHVESIQLRDTLSGREQVLDVDGIFISIGSHPNTEIVTKLLRLDESGCICAGENCATEIPGIFAAGDIRTKKLRQIVTAVSDGANAISSAEAYLNGLD